MPAPSRRAAPRAALALTIALAAAACATRPDPADPEAVAEYAAANDPIEPLNRASLAVTYAVDTLVLRPAAEAYSILLPPPVRTGIRNALGNLRSPVILANNLLQGDTDRAATTLGRFLLNSTVGVGGLFDVAAAWGLPGRAEDFGQTFALWGIPEGPYLFLPVLGPSNPRDLAGFGADIAANPITWIGGGDAWIAATRTRDALTALDTREALIEPVDAVMSTALDPYSVIRSAYRQRRAAEIAGRGNAPPAAPGTGFGVGMGMGAGDMAPQR